MIWYLAGLLWVIHLLFWGVGLALLILPARWRRFWLAFCGPAGLALQTAVVWAGTHSPLPGTDCYAALSLMVPAALFAAAVIRCGGLQKTVRLLAVSRRWSAIAAVMVLSLVVQAYPFTKPPGHLTSATVGSCDAADYAAGARVFKEFSRNDRSGFLGVSGVSKQLSVDNFFDFWLRLNHFSPSALIALNATLSHRQPYELTSLLGIVLLTWSIPVVFWLARSGFRLGQTASTAVCAIYGFSPIVFYAVYQTALAQLIAAPAVALLTWAGLQAYRQESRPWRGSKYFGLILIGNWLLLGGYNFFVAFAYVPLFAYVGWQTLRNRTWARTLRWTALIIVNLAVATALFFERVAILVERFKLFNKTAFGWSIPGLNPVGWYGVVADVFLHPATNWVALCLAGFCLLVLARTLIQHLQRRHWHVLLLAAAYTMPALCGYSWLLWQDHRLHNKASYDAYKLFAVYYPGILSSLCLWMGGNGPTESRAARMVVAVLGCGLIIANVNGALRFNTALRRSTLIVDDALAGVSAVERDPAVTSVNVCLPSYWNRLWANCFLLHKRQYFSEATYEGRAVTALLGDWDLRDRILPLRSAERPDPLEKDAGYCLVDRRTSDFIDVRLDEGWYESEHYRNKTWCWSKSLAPRILIVNPHHYRIDATLGVSVTSIDERHLKLFAAETCVWEEEIDASGATATGLPIQLAPGNNYLHFETPTPPAVEPAGERQLVFMLNFLQIDASTTTFPKVQVPPVAAKNTEDKPALR